MKKKKTILTILIIVLVIILFIFCTKQSIKEENTKNETTTQGQQNIIIEEDKINNIEDNTQENQKEIEEIKQEVGLTGDSNIYEVQTETDGRQIVAVKANIKYKVAFSGMIKQGKPKLEEIDQIFNNNLPKKTGVWIETNSRNKVLNYLNSNYGSKYEINENGYLEISKTNQQTEEDIKLEKAINNNSKQFILDISSVCYIVDDVTGEILDYNFENIDKYQTYEYFEDNNKFIIFISENKTKLLTEKEIWNSVIDLMNQN